MIAVDRRFLLVGLAALAFMPSRASAQVAMTDPAEIEAHIRRLVEEFIARIPGAPDYEAPQVRIVFTPQLAWISYDRPHVIHIAPWEQLPPEFQGFFASLLDDPKDEAVADFYRAGFYSFLVPHEMAHFVDFKRGPGTDVGELYQNELKANRVAVAFWAERPGGLAWLSDFIPRIDRAWARLPVPVPDGEDPPAFFNANYEALGADPAVYAWFQYGMFLEAWRRRGEADFATLVGVA